MDAKVHPARPLRRDAEERSGPVRQDLRQMAAVESVDPVAAPDVVVRHNFREWCQAPARDFRPSASADAELVGL